METSIDWELVREIASCVFILSGAGFMLIASIGLLRFPDFYIRMSAITKGSTLGLGLILMGMAIYFNQPGILLKVLVIIAFTYITAPVAAHVIGRTAVQNGIAFWEKTNLKEFREYLTKHRLERQINQDRYTEEAPVTMEKDGGAGDVAGKV
ncbi:multicomponent Na+:H+ antiporter subunit G [Pontibacter mucosus]|uniref:Multicomponent Na+:H+ antiporter subunit G n=1 Tax=Pontibacter mucosus TaxID=1649266 RepID=A0A2T5YLY7_9BACT|nr:monovalent cation/H(+) antiporter subunit G [Pontibacter mucosus]PTX20338.1 multicomponent Na+:H+ antiporter subunit G [Pontibacter mucosus]